LLLSSRSLWALTFVPAAAQTPPPALDQGYRQSFEKWKAELIQDRKQNWLTLVGLFWLKRGEKQLRV